MIFLTRKTKSESSTAPQKANVKVEICRGINSAIYKKIKSSQGHSSSWLWSLPPVDGVGLVSRDVFLVGVACACILFDGAGFSLSEGQCSVQL